MTDTYPGAIEVNAHPLNYYGPGNPNSRRGPDGHVLPCVPVALVYHTPEEPADDYESTPAYFAVWHPERGPASTRFYLDNDGDVYRCVPAPWGAVANGLDGKPYPAWATVGLSLNLQTDNIEIEGDAATLQHSMTSAQWRSLVDWSVDRCLRFGIVPDRAHLMGHYELSTKRSDPGPWLLAPAQGLVEEVRYRVTEYERKMKELGQYILEDRMRLNGQEKLMETILPPLCAANHQDAERRLRFIYAAAGKAYPA